MARRRTDKVDTAIERAYYRHAVGRSINILNIPAVFREARAAVVAGADLDSTMVALVAKYTEATDG